MNGAGAHEKKGRGGTFARLMAAVDGHASLEIHWIALSLLVLAWDGIDGGAMLLPPAMFLVPVLLAAWYSEARWAFSLAAALPLAHLALCRTMGTPIGLSTTVAAGGRMGLLAVLALLASGTARQVRSTRSLDGLVPICSFCKRIRRDDQSWEILERFISERSQVLFSHTFCPDCAHERFADLLENRPLDIATPMPPSFSDRVNSVDAAAKVMKEQPVLP